MHAEIASSLTGGNENDTLLDLDLSVDTDEPPKSAFDRANDASDKNDTLLDLDLSMDTNEPPKPVFDRANDVSDE